MTVIYDQIGDTYDTTRSADPAVRDRLTHHLELKPQGKYLDVGSGTGNYTTALANIGGIWSGIEPSTQMIEVARTKAPTIEWVQSSAEKIPFRSNTFDGVMCTLAIHHFSDLQRALTEMDRVLRDNGKLVLFTVTPEQVSKFWLCHYFPEMMAQDARTLPSIDAIQVALKSTQTQLISIEPYSITNETEDFFFYSGKLRPAMYLSEGIRNSMSPFRMNCSAEELKQGLTQLQTDITSGKIGTIIERSINDLGDHCFVVLQKKRTTQSQNR